MARLARETFRSAGMEQFIEVVEGDARDRLANYRQVAFLFLDTEKEIYQECYDLVVPNLVPGGFLAADNVISHQTQLASFIDFVREDRRVDALSVPVGKGLLVCRKA